MLQMQEHLIFNQLFLNHWIQCLEQVLFIFYFIFIIFLIFIFTFSFFFKKKIQIPKKLNRCNYFDHLLYPTSSWLALWKIIVKKSKSRRRSRSKFNLSFIYFLSIFSFHCKSFSWRIEEISKRKVMWME